MNFPSLISKNALGLANLETLARLEHLSQERRAEQQALATLRRYYHGQHPTLLSDRQREFLHQRGRFRFCLNYCRGVVDAVAERLRVVGFAAEDPATQAWLAKLWKLARLDALSQQLHLAAIRDGEAFLLADFDPQAGRPRFHFHPADDGTGGLWMEYDNEGRALYAAKRWTIDRGSGAGRLRRLNLYYPDRIEKYLSLTEAPYWQPYPGPGEPFPLPWVDAEGAPLGIPALHFRNSLEGAFSELQDVIPLQDALNKTLIDLIAVADTNAFPLLVARGFEVPEDFSISPGALLQIPPSLDAETDFKALPGADLGSFIGVLEHLAMEIARVSATPLSRFQASGQVAAEGTLKQQEAGLIAKVERKQVIFGNAWEDAMALALRLQNCFGALPYDEAGPLETLWSPAAPRSEGEHLQMLLLKAQLGVPLPALLAEAGYAGAG